MVSISSSILFTSFSLPWKFLSSYLFKKRMQLHGSFWNCLLTSILQMNRAASPNFLLSAPSTTCRIVWKRANQLTIFYLDMLSPRKSVRVYLFLPISKIPVLFTIEGTVSSCFPPQRLIKSCVFPAPLSPAKAISLLLLFDFFDLKMKKTISNTTTAMRQIVQFWLCSTAGKPTYQIIGIDVSMGDAVQRTGDQLLIRYQYNHVMHYTQLESYRLDQPYSKPHIWFLLHVSLMMTQRERMIQISGILRNW